MKEKTLPRYLFIALLLCCFTLSPFYELKAQQCGSLTNGEMNGTENKTPSGWITHSGTTKIKSTRSFTNLGSSPQGGFIMQISSTDNGNARIQTTISGLIPGKIYTLSWFVGAELSSSSPAASKNTVGYFMKAGNQETWFYTNGNVWKQENFIFTATNRSEDIQIRLPKSSQLLLDGITVSCGGNLEACPSITQGNMIGKINKEPHGWISDLQTARLLSPTHLPVLGSSPQGGLVLMLKENQQSLSRIETKLYGVNPGDTYTLSWYSGVEPHLLGANNRRAAYNLDIEGNSNSYQAIASSWKQESLSFVASSTNPTVILTLSKTRNTSSRILLDGFQITCSNTCDLIIPNYSKN